MKIGLFGGTFDPIHRDHLSMAQAFADELGLQQVLFIPAGEPYHKDRPTQTAAEHRLQMVAAAIADEPRFAVSDIDMVRGGATYTVDTLQILRQSFADDELWWLMGMDSLLTMHTWRRFRDIFRLCNIAVAARSDEKLSAINPELRALVAEAVNRPSSASRGRLCLLQWQSQNISSTKIREAARQQHIPDAWVSEPVRNYIRQHGLYRSA